MRILLLVFSVVFLASAGAAPSVSGVTLVQDPVTRNVRVGYVLAGDRAVVTVAFLTNGIPLAAEASLCVVGDVNRVIEVGSRQILWRPDRECAAGWAERAVTARVTAWPLDDPPDFMAVDLTDSPSPRWFYASAAAVPGGLSNNLYKTDWMLFRKIPAKGIRWRMGGGEEVGTYKANVLDTRADEQYHGVTLGHNYYLSVYEATAQQCARMSGNAQTVANPTHPAVNYSYNVLRGTGWPESPEVAPESSLAAFRARTGLASLDLPTEAEWEFACRCGSGAAFGNGEDLSSFDGPIPGDLGWCSSDKVGGRQPVGQKVPNRWGLYDMHGNVAELCRDWYAASFYAAGSEQTNPVGATASEATGSRVTRGGAFVLGAAQCRSASRSFAWNPSEIKYGWVGFRLACAARAE